MFGGITSPRLVRAADEQALIVTIPLRSGDMGDANERKHILDLENQLSAAIKEAGAGEFDGDEFGKESARFICMARVRSDSSRWRDRF
jgi:hypothetical protein